MLVDHSRLSLGVNLNIDTASGDLSAFCRRYKQWKKHRRCSMRQVHKADEKLFVDDSGKRPQIVDPQTGEVSSVELFVAVLDASTSSYAEATLTQQSIHIRQNSF